MPLALNTTLFQWKIFQEWHPGECSARQSFTTVLLNVPQTTEDCPERRLVGVGWGSLSILLSRTDPTVLSIPLQFLTSWRDVETVELSFTYHLALELPLCFLRQVTGKRLVWGGGRLNEGSNHCGAPVVRAT